MNCKPGDLAAIKASPIHEWLIDRVVTVLYAAPAGQGFVLPDGVWHRAVRVDRLYWVCEFPMDIPLPMSDQLMPRMGRFAPVPDQFLRPIRPQSDDAFDEMLLIAGLPQEVVA